MLADPTGERETSDLHTWLLLADDDERRQRARRLTDALVSFDAATIATIHQFCQLVLRSLGVAGDTDASATLVEDLDQLTTEVVDDLYLARFAGERTPPWSRDVALRIAREVVGDPRAVVEPRQALDEAPDSEAAARVRFALDVLAEIDVRKRRLGVLSYDDLLVQLADALAEEDAPARARMRHRWKVVLIDEFQDTDPVQWQVFDRAFTGAATMVLIGDPKQAIYAFRGGDIVTYLQAAETAGETQTLGVNYRSDAALLHRLQALLQAAELGDQRIVVHPVEAFHPGSRLEGAGDPFRLRVVRRAELGLSPRAKVTVGHWRDHVTLDVAREIKRLLTGDATFEGRPVRPGDVAVLAARRAELQAVQEALAALGVPAVISSGGTVFHTPAATEWLTLLEAIEQPHRTDRVRAAALTSFFGISAADLEASGDDGTDRLADRVRTLADVFAARGVAAVLEATVVDGLTARVLARVGGERTLTDLRHIGEALHKVSVDERLGIVGLLAWLRAQVDDEQVEVASERTRRLDSDAEAVQLVTIHGSKGLQYPIVYAPTLWNRYTGNDPDVPLFHDDAGHRARDVGGASAWRGAHVARHRREDAGEALRLLYVALTRAQSQVVAWYAPAALNTPASPLHRLLFGRRPGTAAVPDEQAVVAEDRIVEILGHWRAAGGPEPELADSPAPDTTPIAQSVHALAARRFTRAVDTAWRRTSYSALSAAATTPHGASLSEPEEVPELEDDDDLGLLDLDAPAAATDLDLAAVPSPMATLPVGATFGSLVHAVLEHADPGRRRLPGGGAGAHRRAAGVVAGRPRRRRARRRPGRGVHEPARAPGRRGDPARGVRRRPAHRARLRAAPRRRRRRVVPRRRGAARRPGPDAAPTPARGRSRPGVRRRARRRRRPGGPAPHRLPDRLHRPRPPGRGGRSHPLPDGRLQDQLARRPGGAADRPRLPARRPRRGDGPLRLPVAGAAVRRGAAPLPALAPPRLRPGRAPRWRALPLPPRHVRTRHAAGRRTPPAASSPGDPRWPWSRSCRTCWTESERE